MKRKLTGCLIVLLAFVLILNSCALRITTIDELISPPRVQDLNKGIRTALEGKIGSVYTLKSPSTGDDRSAFVLSDLNGDGHNEAIAFYQINSSLNNVRMMLFQNDGSKWSAVQELEGQGNGVYSVDFADFDHDGVKEVVVGWEAYNNKLKRGLSIYRYVPGAALPLQPVSVNLTFSAKAIVDIDEDQNDELLLFSIESSKYPSEAMARLYGYNESGQWALTSEAVLDGSVSSYTNVCIQKNVDGKGVAVYVDGTKGETSMITERVVWDDAVKMIKAPFYDETLRATRSTMKGLRVLTRDINGDGMIEIAGQEAIKNNVDTKYAALVHWSQVKNDALNTIGYSLINFNDGYMIAMPSDWVPNFTLFYNEKERMLILGEWSTNEKNESVQRNIMSIIAVQRSEWKANPKDGYTQLLENGDLVYAAKLLIADAAVPFTVEDLKDNIAIYV